MSILIRIPFQNRRCQDLLANQPPARELADALSGFVSTHGTPTWQPDEHQDPSSAYLSGRWDLTGRNDWFLRLRAVDPAGQAIFRFSGRVINGPFRESQEQTEALIRIIQLRLRLDASEE